MKHIIYTILLIFAISCSKNQEDRNRDNFPNSDTAQTSKPIIDQSKLDLDLMLSQEHNILLASLEDSVLSLCCYDLLDITNSIDYDRFDQTAEEYFLENQKSIVDVYTLGESFLKKYYNDHPEVMHTDLVSGRIRDDALLRNNRIQIGMKKAMLLNEIFQPTETYAKINRLDIFESELGESSTSYRFVNDRLEEIVFDSDYDWIEKELE